MSTIPQSVCGIAEAVTNGQFTAMEILQSHLERIEAQDTTLGCFQDVRRETAEQMAEEVDASIRKGNTPGPLAGVPIAFKDNIMVAGEPATCGSRILESFISPYDATVTERLRDAGAVFLGRTRCDEFAMGSSTEYCAFGPVRNPWGEDRVPGGSSGGSAAAVAAGMVSCALGSDTGGSIRQPAAFCGITGLKPSAGRVSRWGLVSFAPSMDQIGPFTHDAADAALVLSVMSGEDQRDDTSASAPAPSILHDKPQPLKGIRIGIPIEHLSDANHPDVNQAVRSAANTLQELGCELVDVSLQTTELGIACYYILGPAEASSNLARFDGIRYGRRANSTSLDALYKASRTEGLGAEARRRILLGTYVLSAGYYDAYYRRAQQVRRMIHDEYQALFTNVDAIIGPTVPAPAFKLGSCNDPLSMYLCDTYTVTGNIAGICGLSMPAGMTTMDGETLPLGVQLQGPVLGESTILNIAHAYQQATDHHQARPDTPLL